MIPWATVRLDQRSLLRRFPFKHEHDLRFHLLCDRESRIAGREIVGKLRSSQRTGMRRQET